MPLLALDAVQPGSVLSAPVTDARGNVLLAEGKTLTDEWLKRLKGRGVTRVQVQDGAPGTAGAGGTSSTAGAQARLQRMEAMFARAPQEPLMQALAAAARQVLSEGKS